MLNLPTFDEIITAPAMPMPTVRTRTLSVIEAVPEQKLTRVACYIRVSTEHEDQKSSYAIQKEHFLSMAAEHDDWEFMGIYCDIVSGTKKEKRPELQRLLADCEKGRVQLVLTKSISRFARNTTDLLEMVRGLTARGAAIIFDRENIDTRTMESEFLLTILASLAEDESHSISSNCRWGLQKRFKDGTYKISTAPYGYDVTDGNLTVNENEAEIVKEIFTAYLDGNSTRAIAGSLNEKGIPTKRAGEVQKGGRTVSGKWLPGTIGSILDSEVYIGDILLQKTYKDHRFNTKKNSGQYPQFYAEEHHPAIIDRKTFDEVKAMRAEKGTRVRRRGNEAHTFTSTLTCGCCGAGLSWQKNRGGNVYWICEEHRKKAGNCPLPPVPEKSICRAFTDLMASLQKDESPIRLYQSSVITEWREKAGDQITVLERRRDEALQNLKDLEATRSQVQGYRERRNKLRLEKIEAEAELDTLKDNRIHLIEELLQAVHGWDSSSSFDPDTFHRLVKSVTVYGKEEFHFHFRCGYTAESRAEEKRKTA